MNCLDYPNVFISLNCVVFIRVKMRVRSTIQLTSIVTKGMTKSSEIDVVINNGDDDDDDEIGILLKRVE